MNRRWIAAAAAAPVLALAAPAVATPLQWSLEPLPPAATRVNGYLHAVSCSTPVTCMAIGRSDQGTLVNVGARRNWRRIAAPGGPDSSLADVSCPAADLCIAVGATAGGAQLARWDGASWTSQASALSQPLEHVSCPSATFCVATTSDGHPAAAEAWNGTDWTALPPFPYGDHVADLSCASPTFCMVIGGVVTGPHRGRPVTLVWNGSAWSDVTPGRFFYYDTFEAVDCHFDACTVVGFDNRNRYGIFAAYRAGVWSEHTGTPNVDRVIIDQVSCLGPSSCIALGHDQYFDGPEQFAFQSTGLTWRAIPAPRSGLPRGALDCHLVNACYYTSLDSDNRPVIQYRDDGQWVDGGAVGTATADDATLNDTSCVEAQCMAVGTFYSDSAGRHAVPYAQRFDGSTWQTTPLPAHGQTEVALSVSCATTSFCVATGYDDGGAESWVWDGAAWTKLRMNPSNNFRFNRVSCADPTMCLAVGTRVGGTPASIVYRFDGQTWSALTPPHPGGEVVSVSCPTNLFCAAVSVVSRTASVAFWRGSDWSDQVAPGDYFRSVFCLSTTLCLLAGYANGRAAVDRFDGTQWSAQTIPSIDADQPSVSCASASLCTVVESYSYYAPTAVVWDGARWRLAAPVGPEDTHITGVSCAADSCLAVGYHNDNSLRPLAERLS